MNINEKFAKALEDYMEEKGVTREELGKAIGVPYLCGKGIIFNYKGNYLPQHIFDRYWKNYCRETGIKCTPHQLRHCFATMLYEGGISPKDAQYLLGHSQLSTTMDIYTDIRQQREKDIAEGVKSIDIRVEYRV